MSVYVDDAFIPYRRMKMCHMIADTHGELVEMATKLGLPWRYIQKMDTPEEHFDISMGYRLAAIRLGAKAVSSKALVAVIQKKRAAQGSIGV